MAPTSCGRSSRSEEYVTIRVPISKFSRVKQRLAVVSLCGQAENTQTISDSQDAQTAVAQAVTVLKESQSAAGCSRVLFLPFPVRPCRGGLIPCVVFAVPGALMTQRSPAIRIAYSRPCPRRARFPCFVALLCRFYEKAAEATSLLQQKEEPAIFDAPYKGMQSAPTNNRRTEHAEHPVTGPGNGGGKTRSYQLYAGRRTAASLACWRSSRATSRVPYDSALRSTAWGRALVVPRTGVCLQGRGPSGAADRSVSPRSVSLRSD